MCHFESRRRASRENVCRTACQDEVWAPCAAKLQMVIYRNRPWQQSHYYSDAVMMIGWTKFGYRVEMLHKALHMVACNISQVLKFKSHVFNLLKCGGVSLHVLRINIGPYGWRFSLDSCLSGDRWVHCQVLDCACKHPTPEPNEALSCSFYVYSLLCFSSVLRSKARVCWIPCTVLSNQALVFCDSLHGCLLYIHKRD